jgi:hypothetical protein
MKHIEYSSEAWNTSPTQTGASFESTIAVLKSSLGKRWPLSLGLLIIVVFLPVPVFIFISKIRLDPALFVTEWLRLTIEGLLFFFILEIVRHRSMSFTARTRLSSFVAFSYLAPIQGVIESLENFRQKLESNNAGAATESITDAREKWRFIEQNLSDSALYHLTPNEEVISWLLRCRNELQLERCTKIMESLSRAQMVGDLNQGEFGEIIAKLQIFLTKMKSI